MRIMRVGIRLRKFVTIITTSTEGTMPTKSYTSKLCKVKTADSTMCVMHMQHSTKHTKYDSHTSLV